MTLETARERYYELRGESSALCDQVWNDYVYTKDIKQRRYREEIFGRMMARLEECGRYSEALGRLEREQMKARPEDAQNDK